MLFMLKYNQEREMIQMKRFTFNGKKYVFRKEVLISNLSKLAIGGMLLALYSCMLAGMLIAVIEKYN